MLDIGWSELLVLAIVAIVVVGPKDLPKLMRTVGFYAGKARRMAADFQRQFNEVVAESEADEVRKNLEAIRANLGRAPDLNQPIGKPLMTGPSAAPESDFVTPPQASVEEPPLPEPRSEVTATPAASEKTAGEQHTAKKATANKRAPDEGKRGTAKQSATVPEDGELEP